MTTEEIMQLIQSMIWLLAGVGIFIVGMNFMSEALEKCAGSGMKQMLAKICNNPFSGVTIGAGVTAIIELKVTPMKDHGFDDLAHTIAKYDEVDSVFLLSGANDLSITITGTSLRKVALFVSERLAVLDGVLSTTTHFVLRRYKEKNHVFNEEHSDERSLVSP